MLALVWAGTASAGEYSAAVVSVWDGDTIRAVAILGHNVSLTGPLLSITPTGALVFRGVAHRLYGIQAPEVKGASRAAGIISRDALRKTILGRMVTLQTFKDKEDHYGRPLAVVLLLQPDGRVLDVNQSMVLNGLAIPFMLDAPARTSPYAR